MFIVNLIAGLLSPNGTLNILSKNQLQKLEKLNLLFSSSLFFQDCFIQNKTRIFDM